MSRGRLVFDYGVAAAVETVVLCAARLRELLTRRLRCMAGREEAWVKLLIGLIFLSGFAWRCGTARLDRSHVAKELSPDCPDGLLN